MSQRIRRPDIPKWIAVYLTDNEIRLTGRYRTPTGDAALSLLFWTGAIVLFFHLVENEHVWGVPFFPAGIIYLALAFLLRFTVIRWLAGFAASISVEFTRDGRIRVPGRWFFHRTFRLHDTFRWAFGVVDPDELQRITRLRHDDAFGQWWKWFWVNSGQVELRFGARQIPLGTFTNRRRAEEFVAACNWARSQVDALFDVDNEPLLAA